jgi:isochorismate hydrolase
VIENTKGSELLDNLDYSSSDFSVIKSRYSGFFKTNLKKLLLKNNIDNLIFCGINTHACVRTTIIDAYQNDFTSILAVDCVASYNDEYHRVSLDYLKQSIIKPMTNKEIGEFILSI